jgi:hypothetical protein
MIKRLSASLYFFRFVRSHTGLAHYFGIKDARRAANESGTARIAHYRPRAPRE